MREGGMGGARQDERDETHGHAGGEREDGPRRDVEADQDARTVAVTQPARKGIPHDRKRATEHR